MALRRSGSGKPDISSLSRIGNARQREDGAITAIDGWRRGSPGSVKVAHFLTATDSLWKFTKKQVLYGKHYGTFADFCAAIDGCLAKIPTDHREKLNSLMTHNFQTFNPALFLAA